MQDAIFLILMTIIVGLFAYWDWVNNEEDDYTYHILEEDENET